MLSSQLRNDVSSILDLSTLITEITGPLFQTVGTAPTTVISTTFHRPRSIWILHLVSGLQSGPRDYGTDERLVTHYIGRSRRNEDSWTPLALTFETSGQTPVGNETRWGICSCLEFHRNGEEDRTRTGGTDDGGSSVLGRRNQWNLPVSPTS